MKVLIYTTNFAPKIGGLETIAMSLAKGLARLNGASGLSELKITVVTSTPRDGFDDSSLPFRLVRQPGGWQLLRLIRATDVLHIAGPCLLPMMQGLALRKPVVVEHHGFQTICPNGQLLYEPTQTPCPGHFMAGRHAECIRCNRKVGLLRSLRSWLLTFPRRWLCQRVQTNIMPTNWLGGVLQLPRSTTVYHGVPKAGCHEDVMLSADLSTFAFLGRLVSTKGVRILLQAAQQLKEEGFQFRLLVIGDGPDRELLKQQVGESSLQDFVEFLGYVPPEALEKHLSQAATIVVPSLAGEVFGMVAAENMARGKLVIASAIGPMPEVIADAGLCCPPGDVASLAERLKSVLNDVTLPAQFGAKAGKRASEHFDESKMLLGHLSVYKDVASCGN